MAHNGKLEFVRDAGNWIGGAPLIFDESLLPERKSAVLGGHLPRLRIQFDARQSRLIYAAFGGRLQPIKWAFHTQYDLNVWRGLAHARADAWRHGGPIDCAFPDGWRDAGRLSRPGADAWRPAPGWSRVLPDGWRDSPRLDAACADQWRPGQYFYLRRDDGYIDLPAFQQSLRDQWRPGRYFSLRRDDGYIDLLHYVRALRDEWRRGLDFWDAYSGDAWTQGAPLQLVRRDEWRHGARLRPGRTPWPPARLPAPNIRWHSGLLDFGLVPWTPVTGLLDFDRRVQFPVRVCYLIMTEASVIAMPGGLEIPSSEVSISYDWESWNSDISIKLLGRPAYLSACAASWIEAVIQGRTWKILTESIKGNRSFARDDYSYSGLGHASELAAPRSDMAHRYNSSARTVAQLADDVLLNTGWTIDWAAQDWLVPIGAWSYYGTPMGALSRLAEAAGAYIVTDRVQRQLSIRPYFPIMPWEWGSAPCRDIPAAIAISLGFAPRQQPQRNAVYVSGETQGVLVRVYRQGTAGDLLAPMITDQLITHSDAAVARGRVALAQGGDWERIQLRLPLDAPGGELPLLELGDLVCFHDQPTNEEWWAVVSGVSISAAWRQGLTVYQDVILERYRGQ